MRLINEEVIEKNIKMISQNNEIMLVLKDNAYGFGIERIIKIAKKYRIKNFAVKSIDEAILIKKLYIDSEVLILGRSRDLLILKKYNLIGTINDYDEYLEYKKNHIRAHLAIDVGMNRFGMKRSYIAIINDKIIEAIYAHVYDNNKAYEIIEYIEQLANKYHKNYHLGGSICYGKTRAMIRIGRIIYENCTKFIGNIVNIKIVSSGETVGYDSSFLVKEDSIIGVCNIGYSDGLFLYYNGNVFINGKKYKVIGKCCMDQCFILLDDKVKIGDEVEFYGSNISENEFMLENNMTKYELFLQIR